MNPLKLLTSMFTAAPRLQPSACAERVRSRAALLVDVREPGEWTTGVARDAALLPLTDLTGRRALWRPFLEANRDRELLFYCKSGGRSAIAARILAAEGFRTANVGRLADWSAAGWLIVAPPADPSA